MAVRPVLSRAEPSTQLLNLETNYFVHLIHFIHMVQKSQYVHCPAQGESNIRVTPPFSLLTQLILTVVVLQAGPLR